MGLLAIKTTDLTKFYGRVRGIEGLNLEVAEGEVFGFLGPNGAGKTTTIRLFLDLLRPSRGSVQLLGLDSHRDGQQIKSWLGYLPGEVSFYGDLTGHELLRLRSTGDPEGHARRQKELSERFSIDLSRPIKTYSSGTRQKLALLQAFVHDPRLLILDEPTLGLDPLMQGEFYRLVAEERQQGKTIFLSSHILPEVERVCDRVGIVREGRLVAVENIAELKHKKVRRMELWLRQPVAPEQLNMTGVTVLSAVGNKVELEVHGDIAALLRRIAQLPVEDLVFPEASLEDTFMKFYARGEK